MQPVIGLTINVRPPSNLPQDDDYPVCNRQGIAETYLPPFAALAASRS